MRLAWSWKNLVVVPALALGAALLVSSPALAVPVARSAVSVRAAGAAAAAGSARSLGFGPAAPRQVFLPLVSAPSIPVGSGPVPNGTFLSFSISDKVSLRVNVGSGDALLTTSDIAIPEIGSTLMLGTSYNSLLVGSGVAVGSNGYGWRSREGADVQLYPADDGSVTFLGEDGTAGKFTPAGAGYTSPAQFHVTLVKSSGSTCGGTGYTMTWHATGEVMCFTTAGLLASEADRNGNTTAYTYNGSGQETQITFTPHGASSPVEAVSASYTGSYLTGFSQNGGSAGTRAISYNVNSSTGNLTSVTQADGTKVSFGYDSSHDLTSITNGNNDTTMLGYNSSHQVTSVTQATTGSATATTRLDYTSATQTLVADPSTNQSDSVPSVPHVTYTIGSSSSLVTQAVDQQDNTRSATYTPFDDVATYTNGVGGKTTSTYGSNSGESLTKVQSPTGATSSWAYNNQATSGNPTANFQPSSSTDPQGNASAYTYDGAGNLSQTADALPATAKVTFNSDGTPATSADPKNSGSTSYGYNSAHQLTKITPVTGNTLKPVTITYDGFGRVATVTDGNGNTVTYTYDLSDRVTKAAYTGGSHAVTVSYAYDGDGNVKTQTDPSGTITYGYDGRNLVTSRTATSGGGTLSYGYDLDANLTSVTDAGGTTTYLYNTRNLMYKMTDPAGNMWSFSYDADGRRTDTWFDTNTGNSVWAAKLVTTYDSAGRVSRIQAFTNSSLSNPVYDTSWCHSPFVSGKSCPAASASTDTALVQYATNNLTSTNSVYTYDAGNRLKSATNIGGKTYSYGYDADGNITTGAAAGSLSYNTGNQITTGGYGYDGAGNQTASPGSGTLAYNDAGQMTSASASPSGNGPENFTYAGDTGDQLLSDGTATGITYGLAAQAGQPWVQSYTAAIAGSPPVYVLHDQQGTPLGMIRGGKDYAYVTDNLGSVVALINTTGTTAASYTYDPYGNVVASSGNQATQNLIRYTGGLADPVMDASTGIASTGWTHLGQRWQNPATGAFTTQDTQNLLADPANGNRYAYAADNPTTYTDPTGHNLCDYLVGGLFGIIGIAAGFALATTVVGTIFFGAFIVVGGIAATNAVC